MRSAPTTSIDLADPALVADPYPALAAERARHEVTWDERSQRWLVLSHAAVSAAQRDRRLGRVWADHEPTDVLEPFNLLHRHQMMENEPPEHTRLRRPVARAFARGHVERLRPRVRALAGQLLDEVGGGDFDVLAAYAEPLPVLVIAELLGVPASYAPDLRRWSQAIVRMYEPVRDERVVTEAVAAASDFAALVCDLVGHRRRSPAVDLLSDLAATDLTEDEVVAAVVLLLNAGHEASVNVFGNGLVALLRRGPLPDVDPVPCVEEMLRFDSALQLFERTATEHVELAGVRVAAGERVALLLGSANRDARVFDAPDELRPDRSPNPHLAFGAGVHFCLGAPLARMELAESLAALRERLPRLALAGEPVRRPTFVLRGYREVPVTAGDR
ncbi:hypothetical protein LUZ63_020157 [Rhynchospora breviuscula]|uniref:Cytochrome P450 n=1 Tax=Rhynchospora breviuscula TaxID=2022672 RepID=A0A9P9ZA52_9POAL|nr:hypothetical protein LUZ63_020157 [Rhynchospora breviuscula]